MSDYMAGSQWRKRDLPACGNCGGRGWYDDANGDTHICGVCHGTAVVLSERFQKLYDSLIDRRENDQK